MQADGVIFPGPLCERTRLSDCHLHHPALDPPMLCSRFHPPRCSIQDCAAGVRWFVGWSLRVTSLSHDISMLAHCIFLEQSHRRRALHQCTRHVDCPRHSFPCLGYLCRRTPAAYDLESPDNKTGEDCCQRHVPSGVLVRSKYPCQKVPWLTGNSIAVVNLIRLPQLIYVGPDDLTCTCGSSVFDELI